MKRPKLLYVPGMLSLLIVPVLFYIYQPVIKTTTVLRLYVPTDYAVKAGLKGKKINTVYLDDNHQRNVQKLDFVAYESLKLMFYHDTTQIIKVHFTDETTYGEFVQLVNIMNRDGHKRYAWLDDDFYIFGDPPPHPFRYYYQTY